MSLEVTVQDTAIRSFVGRSRELVELSSSLDDAIAGRGRLFLVSGEPGIGKTWLADEVARLAAERRMRVAWGRSWEGGGAPAYWPWVQVLRTLVVHPEGPRARQPLVTPEIGQLIPELSSETNRSAQSDPDQARFRLFDSVATMLKDVARSQPQVLIFDDLHEADQASLEMLKFVARGLRDSHIVVIGNYRDAEVRRSQTLSQAIAELLREGNQIPLAGVAETEVARMVEARAAIVPSESFVADLHHATAGNPLFVDGVVRVLIAEGRLAGADRLDLSGFKLPEGVRGAIRKRLELLSAEARSALAVAAVIGQEFDVVLLERVNQESGGTLAELMREASEVGVVAAASSESYRFTHPLIREALYKDSTDAERRRLHRVIGEALEEMHATKLTPHLAALANHFREAGIVEKAIAYSVRAGESAYAVLAFEDAAAHWLAALALMEGQVADDIRRAGLLYQLGDPMLLGLEAKGLEYLEEALRLYKSLGRTREAAGVQLRIGFALMSMKNQVLRDIPRASAHFREAEAVLRQNPDDPLLGWLHLGLARVAGEMFDRERRLKSSRRAMVIGKRLGDELLWINAATQLADELTIGGRFARGFKLYARAWEGADRLNDAGVCVGAAAGPGFSEVLRRDSVAARRWVFRELQKDRVAKAPSARQQLSHFLGHALVVAGEPTEARTLASEAGCLYLEATVCFLCGDWEHAEKTFLRSFDEQAHQAGRPSQAYFALLWLAKLRRAVGQFDDAEGFLKRAIDVVEKGRAVLFEVDARQELSALLGEIGAPERAHQHLARCREIMTPDEDWRGLAGAVARAEAIVAAAEGRLDDAQAQFAHAVKIFQRCEVHFDEAEALDYWGRALVRAGDTAHANEKFDAAIELYRRQGAGQRWIDRVEAARRTTAGVSEAILRREGEFWTLTYGRRTSRLKDAKGLHYIARLLQCPGEQVSAIDLAAVATGVDPDAHKTIDLGDAGEVLDAKAKAVYKRRLDELREEIERLRRMNDIIATEKAEAEYEALSQHLIAAAGFGGHTRRTASHRERARVAVTKSIKTAIESIRACDSALGRHLGNSIRTGHYCCYECREATRWHV